MSSPRGIVLSSHFSFTLGRLLCVCLTGSGIFGGEPARRGSGCGGAAENSRGLVPAVALGPATQRRCMSDCHTCAPAAAGRPHSGVAAGETSCWSNCVPGGTLMLPSVQGTWLQCCVLREHHNAESCQLTGPSCGPLLGPLRIPCRPL